MGDVGNKYSSLIEGALSCGAVYVRNLKTEFVNVIFLEKSRYFRQTTSNFWQPINKILFSFFILFFLILSP